MNLDVCFQMYKRLTVVVAMLPYIVVMAYGYVAYNCCFQTLCRTTTGDNAAKIENSCANNNINLLDDSRFGKPDLNFMK